MPPCGISYPRASRGGTLVSRSYRHDHASATRCRTSGAMSHFPTLLVIRHSAGWRGELLRWFGGAHGVPDPAFSKKQQHGTKERRSAGHFAPPHPMLLYICNKCIYMSEAGKPRRYWARGVEKSLFRPLTSLFRPLYVTFLKKWLTKNSPSL